MSVHYEDDTVTLHHGDALAVARTLPAGSVRTIITSPPYWGLRDYAHEDQIGAEPTVQAYVEHLVDLFRELRRVLADDGTLWLNLGDSYVGKSLVGAPWRVALALAADGWILRSEVIWAKPNPMPESVTDRPTKAHEQVFLLAKNERYRYDAAAIAEPATAVRPAGNRTHKYAAAYEAERGTSEQHRTKSGLLKLAGVARETRNRRDVWEIGSAPFPGAHFATFPPALVRPCVLAGSAPGDVVLDPFSGSGTTGMVATFEGRRYVGIDTNADYLDLSLRTRFAAPTLNLEGL